MALIDILLLFEHSGYAAEPFTKMGFNTAIVDMQNAAANPRATYTLDWNILEKEQELRDFAKDALLVIGFPPCTDLAVSGAAHFENKARANSNFQQEAVYLAQSVERIANGTTYMLENPRSRLATLWRPANFHFEPYEYGGYLPEDDTHPEYPEYIQPRDAYPKTTYLWTSDDFTMPPQKWVQWDALSKQHLSLGGKSQKTKNIRSASPRGFFIALAEHVLKQKGQQQ